MHDPSRNMRRPTIAAIAERAGVSRSTVSHILNRKEPFFSRFTNQTRQRVVDTAVALGYEVPPELRRACEEAVSSSRRRSSRPPRIADVARLAGVSKTTASYILSNSYPYVSQFTEETRARVLQAAHELEYAANVLATGLRRPSSGLIGVYIGGAAFTSVSHPAQVNPMAFQLMQGVNEVATDRDLLPIVRLAPAASDRSDTRVVKRLRRTGVSGLLLHAPSAELVTSLVSAGNVPAPFIIMLGLEYSDATDNWVDMDNRVAGRRAAECLLERGHTRVAVLCETRLTPKTQSQRVEGVKAAFAEHGHPLPEDAVLDLPHAVSEADHHQLQEMLLTFLRSRPYTAIAALTGGLSHITAYTLAEYGLRVPEDYDLVVFDMLRREDRAIPELATIQLDWVEAGRLATRRLIEMVETGQDTTEPLLIPPTVTTTRRMWDRP